MGQQSLLGRDYVLSMGNQLSTWNLTHQSAVRGPSFDEFPGYNQDKIFSDYTWFYIGIGATAGVALLLILFNFLLVLKFSEKLCGARFSAQHRPRGGAAGGSQHQMGDLEMMEDGQGTMMDFNLQDTGSVRSQRTAQSQVGYSPASESGYPQPSYHPREMAL